MSKGSELPNRKILCYEDKYRTVGCHDCKSHEYLMSGGMVYYCVKHKRTETWNEALRCKDFGLVGKKCRL